MLPQSMVKLIRKTRFKLHFEMRAIAAYYKSKPDIHPDPSMTDTFFIPKDPKSHRSAILQYVRLMEGKQTLAVFRVTHRSGLKRLKRWPRSIDDGTAVTRTMMEQWHSASDDELDYLLDGFDGDMPPSQDSSEAMRYGFA